MVDFVNESCRPHGLNVQRHETIAALQHEREKIYADIESKEAVLSQLNQRRSVLRFFVGLLALFLFFS